MNFIKFVRIFLLVLIVIGLGLLVTQKMWVPKVVGMILKTEGTPVAENEIEEQPYVKYDFSPYDNTLERKIITEFFPAEMVDYLDNFETCNHLAGEVGDQSPERNAELQKSMDEVCLDFDQAEKNFKAKYSENILAALLQTKKEIENYEVKSFQYYDPENKSQLINRYFESMSQWLVKEVKLDMEKYDLLPANVDPRKKMELEHNLWLLKSRLNIILPQMDRLHPITRKAINEVKNNKVFMERAVRSPWW